MRRMEFEKYFLPPILTFTEGGGALLNKYNVQAAAEATVL